MPELNYSNKLRKYVLEIYNYLNKHPELSWKEFNTTNFLTEKLNQLELETEKFLDCTGVVGKWIGGPGMTVALRADMDALWQNISGKWCANHSCGHDAHMTIVLAAIKILKEKGFVPPGKIKIIFQPAEEKGAGALKIIEKGIMDDVEYLYGIHLRPIQEIPYGKAAAAINNGAAMDVTGEIFGCQAHGSRPHLGINVIEVASCFLQAINSIHIDPMIPASVKMTKLKAGGDSTNIIPDYAQFALDLRAQNNDTLEELYDKVSNLAQGVEKIYNSRINLLSGQLIAAAEVNEQAKTMMKKAINQVLGIKNLSSDIITPGGEDFHFYPIKRPRIKATMLGLGCDLQPGLHHPQMNFNKNALLIGGEILAQAIINTFEKS